MHSLNHLQSLEDGEKLTRAQLAAKYVGKQDSKRHLEETVDQLLEQNIVQNTAATTGLDAFE